MHRTTKLAIAVTSFSFMSLFGRSSRVNKIKLIGENGCVTSLALHAVPILDNAVSRDFGSYEASH
jgi:hypothetical protein